MNGNKDSRLGRGLLGKDRGMVILSLQEETR